MVPLSNRIINVIVLTLLSTSAVFSQNQKEINQMELDRQNNYGKEYKDKKQFEKFYKRRKIIGAWQINQLREGALVVRLKTKSLLINSLMKAGDIVGAEQVKLEMKATNLCVMRAYYRNYNFSKLYFIYSNSSDSLQNGIRENIFLDSSLAIDSRIKMQEKFYLIAETDNLYNSSIGFVKEDTAKFVTEGGSPTLTDFPIVIKNKFGHQLKRPFPYWSGVRIIPDKAVYETLVLVDGQKIPFNIGDIKKFMRDKVYYTIGNTTAALFIQRQFTFSMFSVSVDNLNQNLYDYLRANPKYEQDNISSEIKPFLY